MKEERQRILRVKMGATKKGKEQVHLWGDVPGFDFPAMYLNQPGLLLEVGIDPNELGAQALHTNFWAYFVLSPDKTTENGNPYKNITRLEKIAQPTSPAATAMIEELRAISGELRAIKALLLSGEAADKAQTDAKVRRVQALAGVGSDRDPYNPPADYTREVIGDDDPPTTDPPAYEIHDFPPEHRPGPSGTGPEAPTSTPPDQAPSSPQPALTQSEARVAFYELVGPAIPAGQIDVATVNSLVGEANGSSWPEVLAKLREILNASA
jgi:hypothetical protein